MGYVYPDSFRDASATKNKDLERKVGKMFPAGDATASKQVTETGECQVCLENHFHTV